MRWIYRGVVFLVTLGVLALVALALIPGQKLADIAAQRLEAVTGRSVQLEGDVKTSLFPHLSVKTGAVTLENADWSESGPMLTADSLSVGVSLWPLLTGDVRIKNIEFLRPAILLEVAENGRRNWEFSKTTGDGAKQSSKEARSEGAEFTVDLATIKNASLRWVNHQKQQQEALENVDLTLRFPHAGGGISVAGTGRYANTVFAIDAGVSNAPDLFAGTVTPLSLKAKFGTASLEFDGKLGLTERVFEGDLKASANNISALAAALEITPPPITDAIVVSGNATRTSDGAFFLRNSKISVGANTITGDLDVLPGKERPKIKAALKADSLDFSKAKVTKEKSSVPKESTRTASWPTSAINSSMLFLADAEVSLATNKLDFGGLKLAQNQILMRLNAGRAVFALEKTAAYDGALSGEFVMNGRGGLSVGGNLAASNVSIEPLLTDLADMQRFSGKGDFSVKFLGVGNTVDAIMHSLSGEARVAMRDGALKGVDLKQMVARMDADQQGDGRRTVFDNLTASFVMNNGIALTDDLDIRAKGFSARGTGQVDLGERTLDFRLTPTALVRDDGTGGVKVPVRIKGPWAGPRYFIDVEALSAQELKVDQETLNKSVEKAREKAKKQAAKKLGVKQRKGESLEDAARRTIEEAATKELMKILGK